MIQSVRWYTLGEVTNPPDGAVIADTGPLGRGRCGVDVVVSSRVAVDLVVEHRDASNTATLFSQMLYVNAGDSAQLYMPLELGEDERVRVRVVGSVTGRLQASLGVTHLV